MTKKLVTETFINLVKAGALSYKASIIRANKENWLILKGKMLLVLHSIINWNLPGNFSDIFLKAPDYIVWIWTDVINSAFIKKLKILI